MKITYTSQYKNLNFELKLTALMNSDMFDGFFS